MHEPDLVVVHRRYRSARRTNAKQAQWTLHKLDCPYLRRALASKPLPAPDKAYPGTVACMTCKPPAPNTKDFAHGKR